MIWMCSVVLRESFACMSYQALVARRQANKYYQESLPPGVEWSSTMPWLYYSTPKTQWLEAEDIEMKYEYQNIWHMSKRT